MRVLVQDMLVLAHLDEGRSLSRQPVDLSVLASDAAMDAMAIHPSRRVEVDAPPQSVVMGDEDSSATSSRQPCQQCANPHPKQRERPRERREERRRRWLSVADNGQGMTPEETEKAFDRFWRASPSRSGRRFGPRAFDSTRRR